MIRTLSIQVDRTAFSRRRFPIGRLLNVGTSRERMCSRRNEKGPPGSCEARRAEARHGPLEPARRRTPLVKQTTKERFVRKCITSPRSRSIRNCAPTWRKEAQS